MDSQDTKAAIVYHYFEKDSVYRDNFIFFLSLAWRKDLDFFIIVAGETTVDLPTSSNIHYYYSQNLQHDFAGYSLIVKDKSFKQYPYLIFLNCTVRGPFLPPYSSDCWTKPFLSLLKKHVHLSGSTINILHEDRPFSKLYEAAFPNDEKPYSHVQSSVFAITNECFEMLLSKDFFENAANLSKEEAVVNCEIKMSQMVKKAGWNISCLLSPYQKIDYRKPHTDINYATSNGHPQSESAYFGCSLHPFEVIFLKTAWGALSQETWCFHSLNALECKASGLPDWDERVSLIYRMKPILPVPS